MNLEALRPLGLTVFAVGLVLGLLHFLLIARKPHLGAERLFPRQLALLALSIAGLVLIVFALPVSPETRNQVLGLIGLLLSGVFAFSSTTVVSNLFAGLLLRITRPFSTGDFVRCGDVFGRVSERGLFDTEIQSEHRELIALPNAYLISHPIRSTLRSGTIVSTDLSLGYDVHHREVERILLGAAAAVELTDPFVHVQELGDFAVTYRVAGLLTEVRTLMTVQSDLNRAVLDALHEAGVEIASPTIMAQRPMRADERLIPARARPSGRGGSGSAAEDVAFDKAERAGQREERRRELEVTLEALQAELEAAEGDARGPLKERMAALKEELATLASTPGDADDAS